MRVIAGKARRLQLKTPEGNKVRPTSDRIKETLFNILQNDIYGCRFLDLFAGSGGIGIEALSRGASKAYFVDNSRESIKVIDYNVKHTKFIKESTILHMDYGAAIKRVASWGQKFDIIFIDPPYNDCSYENILKLIENNKILAENGIIIVEADINKEFFDFSTIGFELFRTKNYKTNKHLFLRSI